VPSEKKTKERKTMNSEKTSKLENKTFLDQLRFDAQLEARMESQDQQAEFRATRMGED
jgi:hypothetical protein